MRVPFQRRQPCVLVVGERVRRLAPEGQAVLDDVDEPVGRGRVFLGDVFGDDVSEPRRVDLAQPSVGVQYTGDVRGYLPGLANQLQSGSVVEPVLGNETRHAVGRLEFRPAVGDRRGSEGPKAPRLEGLPGRREFVRLWVDTQYHTHHFQDRV